ncbi:alpha/beta fold hydrolase [Cupriavidus sp. D384]|uniref:alpha/beta fold hydrolase n=1 Tax=Cupriavidus sp. D384 TaxID=1538095 RepID=UPI00082A9B3A|nr:alpha/beta fold hydrolase [Cupriavidus sp. D384]
MHEKAATAMKMLAATAALGWSLAYAQPAQPTQPTQPLQAKEGDVEVRDFRFQNGQTLPAVKLHYATLGTPTRGADGKVNNAVLLLHGTTGTGRAFLTPLMQKELFAPGQPLDASRYYIIMPDGLGRGGSSKPSDGQRTGFPRYGYTDVVEGHYRLLTEGLKVDHLRLVLGTSMGGMQTWIWGERHPDMMDALMPVASQPVAMSGRNWLWRRTLIEAIRNDPDWNGGNYTRQPTRWTTAVPVFALMTQSAATLQKAAPTRDQVNQYFDKAVADSRSFDANDYLYWFESSWDYNPEPDLGKIRAPLYAVNFADDMINAVDLGVMQRTVPRVPRGRFVEMPESEHTFGHQTLQHPEVWKPYLVELLQGLPAAK